MSIRCGFFLQESSHLGVAEADLAQSVLEVAQDVATVSPGEELRLTSEQAEILMAS